MNLDPIKVEKVEGLEIPARKPADDETEEKPDFSKLMGIFRKKPKKDKAESKKSKAKEEKPALDDKPTDEEEPIVFVEDETPIVDETIEIVEETIEPKPPVKAKVKDTDEVSPSKPKVTKVKEVKKSEIGGDLDETEEK